MDILKLLRLIAFLGFFFQTNAIDSFKGQSVFLCEGIIQFLDAALPWVQELSNRSSSAYINVTTAFSQQVIYNFQSYAVHKAHIRTEVDSLDFWMFLTRVKFRIYMQTDSLKRFGKNYFGVDTTYNFWEHLRGLLFSTTEYSISSFTVTDLIHLEDISAKYVQCKGAVYLSGSKMSWNDNLFNKSSLLFDRASRTITDKLIKRIRSLPLSKSLRHVSVDSFSSFRSWIPLYVYVNGHTTMKFDYRTLVQLNPKFVSVGLDELLLTQFQEKKAFTRMDGIRQCSFKAVPSKKEMNRVFLNVGGLLYENRSTSIWHSHHKNQTSNKFRLAHDMVLNSIMAASKHVTFGKHVKRIDDILFNRESPYYVYGYATIKIEPRELYKSGEIEYSTAKQWLVDYINFGLEKANLSSGFRSIQLI